MFNSYDVIVVGAGHAGCEAAAAAANMGSKVLLITMNMQTIAQMSCNPAMGGIAKGQIVREVDALGGYSGIVTDKSMLQFRMLNRSKGPAMWSPRAQNDRMLFAQYWREMLEQTENIDFYQDSVNSLLVKNNQCYGVITQLGHKIEAKAVVITSGTFLNGVIHIGDKQFGGGRVAEKAATGITEQLIDLGFEADRLKTGTPPRIDGRSLDYTKMETQAGDDEMGSFSYLPVPKAKKQLPCHVTYTSQQTHDILKTGFDRSPMFTGQIEGAGPRYCPSIEDKINRFADRDRHQLFVEPEGWNTVEIYVNGFSTSLPEEVQLQALKTVPGFENCKMFRPGYAIEYDFFQPTQLQYSLETKNIQNLYFAGQINGTTGYEEAACQGLMAGINAHLKTKNTEPFILNRSQAYIGVLIDDLITKGTEEPYRMFTSRAEYRTLLRQDNADLRLTELSYKLGLAKTDRMQAVEVKINSVNNITNWLSNTYVQPKEAETVFEANNESPLAYKQKAEQILLRPNINLQNIIEIKEKEAETIKNESIEHLLQAEVQVKYASYIAKEQELVTRMHETENLRIPSSFDYGKIKSLGNEAREKLNKVKPTTLGQASRISGINPSDVQILLVHMGR
jgi:tRNA uridine 5-carboxymethylaminomethyl modification enzyme